MANNTVQHKNFESDTIHGHNTFVNEKSMHFVIDEEGQSQSENEAKNNLEDMPPSQESVANENMCLKHQKQKEHKQDLDDNAKMQHDFKLKSERTEFEEEGKRSEFWRKHDDEAVHKLVEEEGYCYSMTPNNNVQHKNFESDTIHGHNTFVNEKSMHFVTDEESQSQSENEAKNYLENMPPSQESVANEKMCLKHQKQREHKQDLDDNAKMQHDFKLKSQRTEFEKEAKRSEFWRKRDEETSHALEIAKQETEKKEHSKNEENCKNNRREKIINIFIEKDNITDLNEHQKDLLELQNSIRIKKEFFKENEEKIDELMNNLELVRNEQEKLKKDIEQEEKLEQNLKLKSNAVKNSLAKMNPSVADEVDQP